MRCTGESTLLGYCTESPKEVLEKAFQNYHITNFDDHHFFGSGDFEPSTPMIGLGIFALENPTAYGINYNGRLERLLQLPGALKAKRKEPISKKDIERIKSIAENLLHESGKFVKRDEILLIERMLKDFQPLEFARIKDVEEMIGKKQGKFQEESASKTIKTSKPLQNKEENKPRILDYGGAW